MCVLRGLVGARGQGLLEQQAVRLLPRGTRPLCKLSAAYCSLGAWAECDDDNALRRRWGHWGGAHSASCCADAWVAAEKARYEANAVSSAAFHLASCTRQPQPRCVGHLWGAD